MTQNPGPWPRDMLELMVAYGFLPPGTIRERAPSDTVTAPSRAASLGFVGVRPRVGQSTVILGLAQAWSARGLRILLVDLDPGEELGRLVRTGGPNAGESSLLMAMNANQPVRPAPTLLPGVEIVTGGARASWEVDHVPATLRREPELLGQALGEARENFDRVLVDCPPAPGALLDAMLRFVDRVVPVVDCAHLDGRSPVWARLDRPLAAPVLGVALCRWKAGGAPDPAWLQRAWSDASVRILDTVVPEVAGLRDPWDVVGGAAGAPLDGVFEALRVEIDQRLENA